LTLNGTKFSPGFRLSLVDAAILAAGASTAMFAPRPLSIVVGTVVGHFFLFCNVFRMSRKPELVWATTFVLLAAATIAQSLPGWPWTVGISVAMAGMLIALEMRKPSYHGVGWQTVNPRLPQWWAARFFVPSQEAAGGVAS
jgi:hypothetical protein